MSADSKRAIKPDYRSLVESVWESQKDALKIPEFRIITAMRTKMMMLQYLITVAEKIGYPGYSPFLGENLALSMLRLPQNRRSDRHWQRDYFLRQNLLFAEEKHAFTYQNSLNYIALTNDKLAALRTDRCREPFESAYLEWISRKIQYIGPSERVCQRVVHTPGVKGVIALLGAKHTRIDGYLPDRTVEPIE